MIDQSDDVDVGELREGFGLRLKAARKRRGYETAKSMAMALEMDPDSYSPYERGRNYPPIIILRRICELTDTTADWLLFGKPAEPTGPIDYPDLYVA